MRLHTTAYVMAISVSGCNAWLYDPPNASGGGTGGASGDPESTAGTGTSTLSTTDGSKGGGATTVSDPDTTTLGASTSPLTTTTGTMELCSNGIIDRGEQCDDGNRVDEDACKNDCTNNVCGDGVENPGLEECDDGKYNSDTGPCRSSCKRNICGDGFLNEGVEGCDNGMENSDSSDCKSDCSTNVCGDGHVLIGKERCDAGEENGKPGVGCSATCGMQVVFVTSGSWTAALGGLEGADLKCSLAASKNAALKALVDESLVRYRAWLGRGKVEQDPPLSAVGPKDRLPPSADPYVLLSGAVVAASWEDLVDGMIGVEFNLDETGGVLPPDQWVWTNVDANGDVKNFYDCSEWTKDGIKSHAGCGSPVKSGSEWTNAGALKCMEQGHLYCVEINCMIEPNKLDKNLCP